MSLPFQVFVLGLLTVFLVLLVVVFTGKGIIWFVNRFFEASPSPGAANRTQSTSVDKSRIAAISTAIHIATGGQGKVVKVEKA